MVSKKQNCRIIFIISFNSKICNIKKDVRIWPGHHPHLWHSFTDIHWHPVNRLIRDSCVFELAYCRQLTSAKAQAPRSYSNLSFQRTPGNQSFTTEKAIGHLTNVTSSVDAVWNIFYKIVGICGNRQDLIILFYPKLEMVPVLIYFLFRKPVPVLSI